MNQFDYGRPSWVFRLSSDYWSTTLSMGGLDDFGKAWCSKIDLFLLCTVLAFQSCIAILTLDCATLELQDYSLIREKPLQIGQLHHQGTIRLAESLPAAAAE